MALQGGNIMQTQVGSLLLQVPAELIRHWGWFLAFGIGLGILGILAVLRAAKATVVSMVFFGWLLIFAAIIEIVLAFMVGTWSGFFLHLLMGILCGVIGFLLLTKPVASAEAITMVMAVLFIVLGFYQIIAPLVAHLQGAGWWVLDGIVTAVLGVLILAQWPVSGLWVIGLFIGIDLILNGSTLIRFALGLHKM
jgi:uncharacterized membrane protein HdeD (DUF308 family)